MDSKKYTKTAIITRTKNRPVLLKRAIESVLSQTDKAFLHVIINDGGDKTEIETLLEQYIDHYGDRLLFIHNDNSLGMEAASNIGIKRSNSTFVTIHDDDDSWHPHFLSRMTALLEGDYPIRNLGGVVCYATEIHEQIAGNEVNELTRQSIASLTDELTLWRICAGNCFPPIAFLYKREVYDTIGGLYCEDLPVQGDWEFNIRFMQKYEIGLLKEHLAFYHLRVNNNTVSNYSNSVETAEKHRMYNIYLRNEYLRRDIALGKVSVGYMMNVNPIFLRIDRITRRLTNTWEKIKKPFKKGINRR